MTAGPSPTPATFPADTDAAAALTRIGAQRAAIDRLNPAFHAFSHPAPWEAATAGPQIAADLAAGLPLAGLSLSVKGNIPVAGLPHTEGSAVFAGRVATEDAGIVARARAAGAQLLGLTTLSELAMYGVRNPFETMGLNPWNPERTAGGSSTGAGVAAALGLADINIGTDSGGSIRNPACHCGAVGFMPRIGALTRAGMPDYSPSLSTLGIIARDMGLVARAYRALSGETAEAAPPQRLLLPQDLVEEMSDAPTLALFEAALARIAAAGIEVVPHSFAGWRAAEAAAGISSMAEARGALARLDLGRAGPAIRARAAAAAALTEAQVTAAAASRAAFRAELAEALAQRGAAAVVTPTWPFAAPLIDAETATIRGREVKMDPHRNIFVRVGNAIDACALTLPMGIYPEAGVPAGLHLMAPGGEEAALLALGARIEAALPALPPPTLPPAPPLRG